MADPNNKNFVEEKKEELIDNLINYFGREHAERIREKVNNTTILVTPTDLNLLGLPAYPDKIATKYDKFVSENKLTDQELDDLAEERYIAQENENIMTELWEKKNNKVTSIIQTHFNNPNMDQILMNQFSTFSRVYPEDLKDETFMTESKKQLIVNLGKAAGFDLGSDYTSYINNEQFTNLLFDSQVHFDISVEENRFSNLAYMQTPSFQSCMKSLENINTDENTLMAIKNRVSEYARYGVYGTTMAFQYPYLDRDDKQMKSVVVLPPKIDCSNSTIYHEMCHAIGTDLIEINPDGSYQYKSGANVCTNNPVTSKFNRSDEVNLITNEAIVEDVAKRIAIESVDNPISYSQLNIENTGYDQTVEFLKPILEDQKEIVEATITSSDPEVLKRNMGQENLEELKKVTEEIDQLSYYTIDNYKREVQTVNPENYSEDTKKVVQITEKVEKLNENIEINKPLEVKIEPVAQVEKTIS